MTTAILSIPKKQRTRKLSFHGLPHRYRAVGGYPHLQIMIGPKYRVVANDELQVACKKLRGIRLREAMESAGESERQYVAHPSKGECSGCHLIYSELMGTTRTMCSDCRGELIEEKRQRLAAELGVSEHAVEPDVQRSAYASELHRMMSIGIDSQSV